MDVVITGGSGGLGGAVVDAFKGAGFTCHVPTRRTLDLTDERAVEAFYASVPSLWASIHVAGGFAMAPIEKTSLADLRGQMAINLDTAFLCCREAVKALRKAGGGRIVNVTSRAALVPGGGTIAYSTSKAALAMLTQSLAEEVRADGILVNAVAPSIIDTPTNRQAMPTANHASWAKPIDIARTILWLASRDNVLTSGAIVPVHGRS